MHTHSTASDGLLSPADLVRRARQQGLNLIALTDHDALHGLEEARQTAAQLGMGFIPGVEISAAGEDEVHILAYHVHEDMQGLVELIAGFRSTRAQRQGQFIEKLAALGLKLTEEDIPTPRGAAFSRVNLARAMVARGYVSTISEAFDRYISVGRPAYVAKPYISVEDCVRLMLDSGAVPVLAHPGRLRPEIRRKVPGWLASGLAGIEAFHPSHTVEACHRWQELAEREGVLITGGSDFHAPGDESHGELGCMLPLWQSAHQYSDRLLGRRPLSA